MFQRFWKKLGTESFEFVEEIFGVIAHTIGLGLLGFIGGITAGYFGSDDPLDFATKPTGAGIAIGFCLGIRNALINLSRSAKKSKQKSRAVRGALKAINNQESKTTDQLKSLKELRKTQADSDAAIDAIFDCLQSKMLNVRLEAAATLTAIKPDAWEYVDETEIETLVTQLATVLNANRSLSHIRQFKWVPNALKKMNNTKANQLLDQIKNHDNQHVRWLIDRGVDKTFEESDRTLSKDDLQRKYGFAKGTAVYNAIHE